MISLLPPNAKKELAAARANVLLLRYLFLTIGVIAFLCIEMAVVYFFFAQQREANDTAIASNQRDSKELEAVKNQANAFNNDLKIAETILSKQVSYTSIIKEFANTMPPNTTINQLSINPATIGKPTTMAIKAKKATDVLAFKDAFSNSQYFENVSIQNIGSQTGADGTSVDTYPFTATINITFKQSLLTLGGNS